MTYAILQEYKDWNNNIFKKDHIPRRGEWKRDEMEMAEEYFWAVT